jgi:hypothetical protein
VTLATILVPPEYESLSPGILRQMRADERTRRLPVVMLASRKKEKDAESSYDPGANSFVRKSVDLGQFVDAARHLGIYWLIMNEPTPAGQRNTGGRRVGLYATSLLRCQRFRGARPVGSRQAQGERTSQK